VGCAILLAFLFSWVIHPSTRICTQLTLRPGASPTAAAVPMVFRLCTERAGWEESLQQDSRMGTCITTRINPTTPPQCPHHPIVLRLPINRQATPSTATTGTMALRMRTVALNCNRLRMYINHSGEGTRSTVPPRDRLRERRAKVLRFDEGEASLFSVDTTKCLMIPAGFWSRGATGKWARSS
jgi:hypothetical protein